MTISEAEAASALIDIEHVRMRTTSAVGYERASPHLIVWGLVWLLGYLACGVLPATLWGLAWLPLVTLGTAASIWVGVRASKRGRSLPQKRSLGQALLATISITAFLYCVAAVTGPILPESYMVLPALILGLAYTLVGLATLPRLAWIGAVIFICTMAGYWLARPNLSYWVAITGGGGLIVGGFWLRRV